MRSEDDAQSQDEKPADYESKEFVGRLLFRPRESQSMIMVSVNRGHVLFDSYSNILPRISVYHVLPSDSLVFQLAASGRVQELKSLVAEGKASLRDHDSEGLSLLHVSNLRTCQMSIRSFLADITSNEACCAAPAHVSILD